jgi:uncharacterized protein (TIGR00369 family)
MTETEPTRERSYTWSDPALIAAEAMQMDGLAFFAAMAEGKIPPPPIAATLGMDAMTVTAGQVAFSLTPQEFHYNPIGTMHGGAFATLLDSACGCAVHSALSAGTFYTSLDLAVKFLRPVTVATGKITATGTVTHLGRRTALAEARITDAAGKLYATATSSCLIFPIG